MRKYLLYFLLIGVPCAFGQNSNQYGAPSNPCVPGTVTVTDISVAPAQQYTCAGSNGHTWVAIGGGGGGGGITALTGDGTASGTGSVVFTLATTGVTGTTCGDTTHSCGLTYDGKGRLTAVTNNIISGGGGGTNPSASGIQYWTNSSTSWGVATAAQLSAALSSDTVNNTAFTFHTGSGGDSTLPTHVSGQDYLEMKSGVLSYGHGTAADIPLSYFDVTSSIQTQLNGKQPAVATSVPSLTDGSTVTWAIASVQYATATLTLVHTTSARTLNLTGLVTNGIYNLILKEDSTGVAGTFTLGTGCTWYVGGSSGFATASTLTLTSTASAINIASFLYDGTNCYVNLR